MEIAAYILHKLKSIPEMELISFILGSWHFRLKYFTWIIDFTQIIEIIETFPIFSLKNNALRNYKVPSFNNVIAFKQILLILLQQKIFVCLKSKLTYAENICKEYPQKGE